MLLASVTSQKSIAVYAETQPIDAEEIARLIKQLGSDSFEAREQAQQKLILIGEPARAQMDKAARSGDAEIENRIKTILQTLAKRELDRARVHVVGLYESRERPAVVEVRDTNGPVILVLCAYEGVTWNVKAIAGVKILEIIASGYHTQKVQGVDAQIRSFSYDQRTPYFYTYDHDEENYPKMRAHVHELTGKKKIASFQGRYEFKSVPFVVGEED